VIGGPVIVSPFAPGLSFYSPGFWGGYAVYGAPGYYLPFADPRFVQPNLAPQPFAPPLADALRENAERWGPELPPARPDPVTLPVAPSSNEAKLKSLRAVQDGDADLQNQQWLQAYMDYKRAVQAAPDSARAYFRQGLALSAVQHYDSAAFSFKRALALDPALPKSGEDLEQIFGPGSDIARHAILLKIADWVRQDVRDPDRLFVFGVWLHFSHDARATEVFETGYRLTGRGQHFLAFLKADDQPLPAAPQPPADPGPQLPPPPLPAP
jgi:tetratricopeptide (TPR) repeat protein